MAVHAVRRMPAPMLVTLQPAGRSPIVIDMRAYVYAWDEPLDALPVDPEHVQIGTRAMAPGDSWTLPDGAGSLTFDGVSQFATFSVASDPGKGLALGAVIAMIGGLMLSLFVRRRRLPVTVLALHKTGKKGARRFG